MHGAFFVSGNSISGERRVKTWRFTFSSAIRRVGSFLVVGFLLLRFCLLETALGVCTAFETFR